MVLIQWLLLTAAPSAWANFAFQQPPTPQQASALCTDENTTPWDGGADAATPGLWQQPNRGNQGWDLIWSNNHSSLKVLLYTYNEQGRPIWLASAMTPMYGGDPTAWAGAFYQYAAPNVQGAAVGSVAIRFFPDDPTHFAVNWDWNNLRNVGAPPQTGCLANLIEVSPNYSRTHTAPGTDGISTTLVPSYTGTGINELFSGYWIDSNATAPDGAPGMSLNVLQPTYPSGSPDPNHPGGPGVFVEFNLLLTFDSSGIPVWLIEDMPSPDCTGMNDQSPTTCSPPPLVSQQGLLKYVQPNKNSYPHGIPINNCGVPPDPNNPCVTITTIGHVSRTVTDETGVLGSVKVSDMNNPPDTFNTPAQPQILLSPNFWPPVGTTKSIKKVTNSTGILPVQYSCRLPSASSTTCSIWVAWNAVSGPTVPTPWKHDLNSGTYLQLSTSQTGEVIDHLHAEDRVAYELWSAATNTTTPAGQLIDQSAEVRAFGYPSPVVGDSSDGAAAVPTAPANFTEPTPPAASADTVGAIAADFRVDESGNANYRIPLVVPPGAGGFTPKLALTYNSGGGMGYFGTGFALEGTSAISPCRPGKEFGDSDDPSSVASALCLDGQRLLLQSGTDRTTGAVYRTEVETFQKVVISSLINVVISGQQPLTTFSFIVYGKDGSVRTYGGSAGTVASVSLPSGQPPIPVAWLEVSRQDVSGNQIIFNYDSVTSLSERKLNSITYSGGQIVFNYQAAGGSDTSYASILALAGTPPARTGHTQRSQLVTSIDISSSALLRHYALCYQDPFSPPGSACNPQALPQVRARLTSVSECADQAGTKCYPATTFDWAADQALSGQGTTNSTQSDKFPDLRSYKLGDFDGDRRSDLLWINGDHQLYVSYSRPDTLGLHFTAPLLVATLSSSFDFDALWEVMDYNGDGLDDILYADTSGSVLQWKVLLANPSGGFSSPTVIIANAGAFADSSKATNASMMADFNGDGLPDLLFVAPGGSYQIAPLVAHPGASEPYTFDTVYPAHFTHLVNGVATDCLVTGSALNRGDAEHSAAIDIDGDGRADVDFVFAYNLANPCSMPNSDLATVDDSGQGPKIPGTDTVPFVLKTFRSLGVQGGSFQFAMFDWLNVNIPPLQDTSADAVGARAKILDINGDGLADFLYRSDIDHHWYYILAGSGTTVPLGPIGGSSCTSIEHGDKLDTAAQQIDIDGDGKVDFWCPGGYSGNNYAYQVYLWKGDGFSATAQQYSFNSQAGPEWLRIAGDYDGDGIVDLMIIKATDNHGNADGGWWANRTTSHQSPRNVITSITNGLGAETDITYSPMTFSSVYRRDFNAPFLSTYGRASPIFDVASPNLLVQYVKSSAPTINNPSDQAIVQYFYRGLKVQAGGRGSLGFRRVSSYDHQTGMEVDTTYATRFPIAGVPIQTQTRYVPSFASDPCLSNADSSACMARIAPCAGGLSVTCDDDLPAANQIIKTVADTWRWRLQPTALATNNFVSVAIPDMSPLTPSTSVRANIFTARVQSDTANYDFGAGTTAVTQEHTSFDTTLFDDLGNPGQITTTNAGGGVTLTTQSAFTYSSDVANWKLSRLLTTTVFNQRSEAGGSTTNGRRSSFTYDDVSNPSDVRKLLRSEKVEGMSGASLAGLTPDATAGTAVTYYGYDTFGNKTATYTCSTGISESACRGLSGYSFHPALGSHGIMRYSRTQYDVNGRFPNKVLEAFSSGGDGFVERPVQQITARDAGGDPTAMLDTNNVTTQIRYGAFGRKYYEWNGTGVSKRYDYDFCNGSNCPANAALAYTVKTSTAGAPATRSFYDLLGRQTVKVTSGFAGEAISTISQYDDHGRPSRKSQPFMAVNSMTSATTPISGASIYWTLFSYDGLDRPTLITNPDGGPVSMSYSGLSTTTTLPPNMTSNGYRQNAAQVKDPAGLVISATDANGLVIRYAYDAAGNPIAVCHGTLSAGGACSGIVTRSTYDTLGRKLSTVDPDAGTRTYVVDDLGQTIQQSSGRGTCTQMQIDARGRLYQRSDYTTAACTGTADTLSKWDYDTASYGVGKLAREADGIGGGAQKIQRTFAYSGYGQLVSTTTLLDGQTYMDQTNYDPYGRVFQTFFTAPGLPSTGELYEYNAYGYQQDFRSAYPGTTGMVYYEAAAMDAYGHVTQEYRSSMARMLTERSYDLSTGRLTNIQTGGGFTQDLSYTYDEVGNMISRHDQTGSMDTGGRNISELFTYDHLQRLTNSTLVNGLPLPPSLTVAYSNEGNITSKGNADGISSSYTYALPTSANGCAAISGTVQPGPHAVSMAGSIHYCYDANGNVISGGASGDTFTYTPYDLPAQITSAINTQRIGFEYGPNREKIRRLTYANVNPSIPTALDVTHYVGSAEVRYLSNGNVLSEVRRYLGPVLVIQSFTGTAPNTTYQIQREYFLTDAQGSTFAVLSDWGEPLTAHASMSFDPFGVRRDADSSDAVPWTAGLQQDLDFSTHHGYTGHEQVDALGIIHMGGRIYDPLLGRFLQADPFVQDPTNSQSLNRFSYVLNNPMSLTDPTGYFSLGEALRDIAAIVIIYWTGGIAGGLVGEGLIAQGAAVAFAGGFAAGALQTGSLKGAVAGAISSELFLGINSAIPQNGSGSLYESGHLSVGGYAVRALASGAAGGVMAELQGGQFGHGFAAAGFSAAFAPSPVHGDIGAEISGAVQAAVIGGTASVIGGGKFANGAITASFQYAFAIAASGGEEKQSSGDGDATGGDGAPRNRFTKGITGMYTENFVGPYSNDDASLHVSDAYGVQRDGGQTLHGGIDIATGGKTGIEALSLTPGMVTNIGAQGFGSNAVTISSWDGEYYTYGHLNTHDVDVGEIVYPGSSLGEIGTLGNSTGIHLHIQSSLVSPWPPTSRMIGITCIGSGIKGC